MTKRIRTLIVDDSATARDALKALLDRDPEIDVFATAADPYAAVEIIAREVPRVIVLDLEMPRMNGLTFLDTIMQQHPIPVVICSAATESSAALVFDALARGAVEVVHKPRLTTPQAQDESALRICEAVRSAASARLLRRRSQAPAARATSRQPPASLRATPDRASPKLSADAVVPPLGRAKPTAARTPVVIAIGASTGGTEALLRVLQQMPPNCPAIAVVQHMPERFTAHFAQRLDRLCAISVKEAADGDALTPGLALLAPGNLHLLLARNGRQYHVLVREGPAVSRHRPAVNVLFRSAARCAGSNAIGVIMTGMGDDGAQGLLEMKTAGAWTIAQDEASCVVFGMPREAIKLGAVDEILSLDQIAPALLRRSSLR